MTLAYIVRVRLQWGGPETGFATYEKRSHLNVPFVYRTFQTQIVRRDGAIPGPMARGAGGGTCCPNPGRNGRRDGEQAYRIRRSNSSAYRESTPLNPRRPTMPRGARRGRACRQGIRGGGHRRALTTAGAATGATRTAVLPSASGAAVAPGPMVTGQGFGAGLGAPRGLLTGRLLLGLRELGRVRRRHLPLRSGHVVL